MDLIDRNILKKELIKRFTDEPNGEIESLNIQYWAPRIVMDIIDSIPRFEIGTFRRGQWITEGILPTTCSECGHIWEGLDLRVATTAPTAERR